MHYHPKCNENALNTHFIVIGALIFSSKSANRRFVRPVLSSLDRPRISVRLSTLGTKTQVLFFLISRTFPKPKSITRADSLPPSTVRFLPRRNWKISPTLKKLKNFQKLKYLSEMRQNYKLEKLLLFCLDEFHFRWWEIKRFDDAFPITITLIFNHLNWNSS